MATTIRDVAKAAGVSVATVSRALNGGGKVLPATRERIESIARELRFTPSGAARSLITRRTDTVGALLPDLHGEFFSELIRGIDLAARARGLHLLLSSSHGDAAEAAAALRAMNGRVDGLIVMTPHASAEFLSQNLPIDTHAILVNTSLDLPGLSRFVIDNHGGALAMTRHLLGSGRERVAFIAGPADNHEAQERLRGYQDAIGERAPLVYQGEFTEASGWEAGRRIAQARPRPDAVFAANDIMAIGCLGALREAGLRVPEDVALGGFDDIPVTRYVSPALTTIHVPIAELGTAALDALARTMDRGADPADLEATTTVLPVELVVRRSCGTGPPARPLPRRPAA